MPTNKKFLYIRTLRHVDHTVFCVDSGQKVYTDPETGYKQPYSSGQQVKRCIMDAMCETLGEPRAPITFNYTLATKNGKPTLDNGEPWSPCDPTFADQLVGGWMRASKGSSAVKRRSPLSISAMRPLHPRLVSLSGECVTFDRSDHPEGHVQRVVDENGNELGRDVVRKFLDAAERNLPMRIWMPADKVGGRTTGLFVSDIAIDLNTLYTVALDDYEPEITQDVRNKLMEKGWQPVANGTRLECPRERKEELAQALASALVGWRISTNQSRTYSPQDTLAIAISDDASLFTAAIRADLDEESEGRRAAPVLEQLEGVRLYVTLQAQGYIREAIGASTATREAEQDIYRRLVA